MTIKYIDIHSHLNFKDYTLDLKGVLERMEKEGVATIVVGTDLESSKEAVDLADRHKNIYACIGAHPADEKNFVFNERDFSELVKNPKVVAIGECGLDYFRFEGDLEKEKERQKMEFIKQIEFAAKYSKPLMLHIRDAYEDAYDILKKYEDKVKGNVHFFTGSLEWAKKFISIGFTISFSGVITFAREYKELVKNLPLNKIHAETDSPFATPIPHRGKRNEPTYVIEVVKRIAEVRGEGLEKVQAQLLINAKNTFGTNL